MEFEKCPYREVCAKCPGDTDGEDPWIPIKGFKQELHGIFCIDWDKLIGLDDLVAIMQSEGRNTSDLTNDLDKFNAWNSWRTSPERKEAQKAYEASDKGKATWLRYQNSPKFKMALQRYHYSEKGQKQYHARQERIRVVKDAEKWMEAHPGKTMEDFFKETGAKL